MTVIATGFEDPDEKLTKAPAAESKPVEKASGLFTAAAATQKEAEPAPQSEGEDPFDSIFKIFNSK